MAFALALGACSASPEPMSSAAEIALFTDGIERQDGERKRDAIALAEARAAARAGEAKARIADSSLRRRRGEAPPAAGPLLALAATGESTPAEFFA